MSRAFLGVEGGGSRARAVLEAGGRVTARTLVKGINPRDIGRAAFLRRLRQLLHPLLADLGDRPAALCACLAVAGLGSEVVRAGCAPGIRRLLGEYCICKRLEVMSDADALVETCLAEQEGIVLIAGTGSVCIALKRAGGRTRRAKAGGRGGLLDRGSGYWIGVEVLRHALRVRDRLDRPAGALELVSRRLGVPAAEAAGVLLPPRRERIAGLVPEVLEAYLGGDRFARGLIDRAVRHLVGTAVVGHRRSGLVGGFNLHLAGGLFASPIVSDLFREQARRALPLVRIHRVDEPLLGVLRLARTPARPGRSGVSSSIWE